MEYFRFTLFNSITLFVLVLTALSVVRRLSGDGRANWPLVYWAIAWGYTLGFSRGLDPAWVCAGTACALGVRWWRRLGWLRWGELVTLGYVAWRCVGLILLW